ncbi:MAG: hypothetical protein EOO70_03315 [Myxococcaceae bacterium]|nr:MAG: hypothetical protein EOO70_03315 [Myxococcaceae bacterium]
MQDDLCLPPLSPNPPRLEWIGRCAAQLVKCDATLLESVALEEAEALFDVCSGEYTPEQAADVATGALQPLHDDHHAFFEGAHGSLGDEV